MMDYYNTLGVPRNATQEDIKKAFRKLAMTHHPDKGGDPGEFQKINEAYDTLGDPAKRAAYDNPARPRGSFGQQHGGFSFNFGGFDLNDIFDQFKRQGFGQAQQHNIKPTFRTRVTVSLVDVYKGAEQVLQLGTPSGTKVINIKIPAGIYSGSSVKYENLIEEGTLIVEFVILPDLRFDREGDDLYSSVSISVLDLIIGTKIEFICIDGKKIEVSIAAGTQPGQQIKISGYGMPRQDGTRGNQILLLKPYIPASIDNEVIESIKKTKVKEVKGN